MTKNIRFQILGAVGLGIALLLSVFVIAIYNKNTIINEYQSQLTLQTELIKRVSALNLDFKIQVQEWKNVLLRGQNPDDLEKYWTRFNTLESQIFSEAKLLVPLLSTEQERKNLNEFIVLYPDMMSKYKAGYKTFIDNGFSYSLGDQAVRGIDRRPSQLLKQVVVEVEEEALRQSNYLQSSAERVTVTNFFLTVIVLILTVWFLTRSLVNKIIAPVTELNGFMKVLAKGDFTLALKNKHDGEIGELYKSVESVREKLGELIKEVLANMQQLTLFIDKSLTIRQNIAITINNTYEKSTSLQSFLAK